MRARLSAGPLFFRLRGRGRRCARALGPARARAPLTLQRKRFGEPARNPRRV